jgi:hypothetical protein
MGYETDNGPIGSFQSNTQDNTNPQMQAATDRLNAARLHEKNTKRNKCRLTIPLNLYISSTDIVFVPPTFGNELTGNYIVEEASHIIGPEGVTNLTMHKCVLGITTSPTAPAAAAATNPATSIAPVGTPTLSLNSGAPTNDDSTFSLSSGTTSSGVSAFGTGQ